MSVLADGGANKPGPDPNSDAEVTLDIEVAGAIAPGAKIAVYFAPNTAQGFIDAVAEAGATDRSLAVRLTLNSEEGTLNDEQIEAAVKAVVEQLQSAVGARQRV